MNLKQTILSIFTICVIFILPHAELLPFFLYTIPVLLLTWLALRYSNENFSAIGFSFNRFEVKAIPVGIIAAVLILAFMQLVFFPVLEKFVTFEETEVGLYDFIRESRGQYLFLVIMGWLVGGIYEEIVFHGFIYTRLEKIIPGNYSPYLCFAITALIFGAYHFQLGMDGLINALIVGFVYLGLFLYFDRNLWYPIICHGVYNTLVMTLIYVGYL